MILDSKIAFKKLETSDLSLIFKWINEPHIHRDYHQAGPYTFQDVIDEYHPIALEVSRIKAHIIYYDNVPIGYIQNYKLEAGDYEQSIPWENTAGYDVFIGDPAYVNRGLGTKILCQFLLDITFDDPTVNFCVINPKISNERAIKVYKKIGFEIYKIVDRPNLVSDCVMRLDKAVFMETVRRIYL